MTHNDPDKLKSQPSKKEGDKYGGVVEFDMALTPSVIICGAAGAVLGAILAMWGTTEDSDYYRDSYRLCGAFRNFWLLRPMVQATLTRGGRVRSKTAVHSLHRPAHRPGGRGEHAYAESNSMKIDMPGL